MTLTKRELCSQAAFVAIVVALPINFLYNYYEARDVLPEVPGLMSVLSAALCIVALAAGKLSCRPRILTWGVPIFLAYIAACVVVATMYGSGYRVGVDEQLLLMNVRALVRCATFYVIGHFLFLTRPNAKTTYLFWLIMAANTLIFANYGVVVAGGSVIADDPDAVYQFLGDAFAVWSCLTIALVHTRMRVWVGLLAVVVLYFIGSRTSMYAFVCTFLGVLPFLIMRGKWKNHKAFIAIGVLLIFSAGAVIIVPDALLDSRMLRFVFEHQDSSWAFRRMQLAYGLRDISHHLILGHYGGQVAMEGRVGDYIHNYLEVWRQFGIVPFTVFLAMAAYLARSLLRYLPDIPDWRALALVLLSVFSLVEVMFARTWGSPYIFMAFGLCAASNQYINPEAQSR